MMLREEKKQRMDRTREEGEGKDGEDIMSSKQTSKNIPVIRKCCCQRKQRWLDLIRQKNAKEFVCTDHLEMTLVQDPTNFKLLKLYNSNGEAQDVVSLMTVYQQQHVDNLVCVLEKQKRKINYLERENKRLDNVNKLVFNKANYNFDSAERFSRKLYEICGDTLKYWKRIRCASENIRDLVYYFRDEVTAYMIQVRAEDGLIQDKIKAFHKRELSYLQEEHEEEKASFIEQINLSRRQMLEREKDHQRALSSRLNSTFTPAVVSRSNMKPLTATSSPKLVISNTRSNEITADNSRQNERRRWRPFKVFCHRSGEQDVSTLEAVESSSKSTSQLDELLHQNQQLVEERNLLQAQLDQMKLEKEILGSNLAKSEMLNDQKERRIAYLNDSIQQLFGTLTKRHIKYSYHQEDEEIDPNHKENVRETCAIPGEGGNARKRTVYHCLIKCRDCCRKLPPSMYASVDFHQVISNLSLGTQQVLQSHQITRFGFGSYLDQEEALWKVCSDFVSHSEASNKDYMELMKTLKQCRDRKRQCRKTAGKGRPHIRPRLEVRVKGWKITSQRKTKRMRKLEKQNHQLIGILQQVSHALPTVYLHEATGMLQKVVLKLKDNAKRYIATQRKEEKPDQISDEDLDSGYYLDPVSIVDDDKDRIEPKTKCDEDECLETVRVLRNGIKQCRRNSPDEDSGRDPNSSFGLDLLFSVNDDIEGIDTSRIHKTDEQFRTNRAFKSGMKLCKENKLDTASEEDHSFSFGLDLLFGEDEDADEIDEDMFWELEDNIFLKHCREKGKDEEGNGYLDSSFCLDSLFSVDNEVAGTGSTASDTETQLSEPFRLVGVNAFEKHKPDEDSTENFESSYYSTELCALNDNVRSKVDITAGKGKDNLEHVKKNSERQREGNEENQDDNDNFDTTCLIEVLFPIDNELEKIPVGTSYEPEGKHKSFTTQKSTIEQCKEDHGDCEAEENDRDFNSSYCLNLLFRSTDQPGNITLTNICKELGHLDKSSFENKTSLILPSNRTLKERTIDVRKQDVNVQSYRLESKTEVVHKEIAGFPEKVRSLNHQSSMLRDHLRQDPADQRKIKSNLGHIQKREDQSHLTVKCPLSNSFSTFNKGREEIRDYTKFMTASEGHKINPISYSGLRPFETKLEALLNAQHFDSKIWAKGIGCRQKLMPHRNEQVSGSLSNMYGYVGRERNSRALNDSNVSKRYGKSIKITRSAMKIQSQYKCTWPRKDCIMDPKYCNDGIGNDETGKVIPNASSQARDENEAKPKGYPHSNCTIITEDATSSTEDEEVQEILSHLQTKERNSDNVFPVSPSADYRNDDDHGECKFWEEIDVKQTECAIKERYQPAWLKRNSLTERKPVDSLTLSKTVTTASKGNNDNESIEKTAETSDAISISEGDIVRAVDVTREEIWLSLKQGLLTDNKDRNLQLSSFTTLLVKHTLQPSDENTQISFDNSLVEHIRSYLVGNQDEVYYPILVEREMIMELMNDAVFHVWEHNQHSRHARELVYYTPNYCRYYERGANTGEIHISHNMDQPIYLLPVLIEAITKCNGMEIHFDCFANLKTVSCYMVRDNNLDCITWKVEIRLDQASKVYEEKAIIRSRVRELPMSIFLELTKQSHTQDASLYRMNKIGDTYWSPVNLRMTEKGFFCIKDGIDFVLNTNVSMEISLASLEERKELEIPMKASLQNIHMKQASQQWPREDQRLEEGFRIRQEVCEKDKKEDSLSDDFHKQDGGDDFLDCNESKKANKNIRSQFDHEKCFPMERRQTAMIMDTTFNNIKCKGHIICHLEDVDHEGEDKVTNKENPLLLNSTESQNLLMMKEETELDQSREYTSSSTNTSLGNKHVNNASNELCPYRFENGAKGKKNDSKDTTTVLNSIDSQISALPRVDDDFANR